MIEYAFGHTSQLCMSELNTHFMLHFQCKIKHNIVRQSFCLYTDCGRQICPLTVQMQNVSTKGAI
jgi:hypothetical protein